MSIFTLKKQLPAREAELVFAQEVGSSLQTIKKTLIGRVRAKMREDRGEEKRNVKGKVTGSGFRLKLEISGDKPQTLVDERGRKKGSKMPPWKRGTTLFDWVRRKLAPPPKKQESVAFLVARKIKRDGIKPNKPFERTEKESLRDVLNELNSAVTRGTRRLNK